MRTGFTTSACAAAAAAAAMEAAETGMRNDRVTISLPSLLRQEFSISFFEKNCSGVTCGVIKDAGDDPDVTNGLEIRVYAEKNSLGQVRIFGGEGVGIVTQPGLQVPVGQAAINPGSVRLIKSVLSSFCSEKQISEGFDITISVPRGAEIAKQTMNPRLGITGGISILGTDGIVRPYSIPAFRASIACGLKFAQENHFPAAALATGKRTAAFLDQINENGRQMYVIDVGDELEYPLKQFRRYDIPKIVLGGMIGKFSKVAEGHFQTHVDRGGVDFAFLSGLAQKLGADEELCGKILTAATAHQVQIWLAEKNIHLEPTLAEMAAEQVKQVIPSDRSAEVMIFSLEGTVLGIKSME